MKIRNLLIVCMFFLMSSLHAQNSNIDTRSYIDVKGVAESQIAPDVINLNIHLKEKMDGKTKITIDKLEQSLIKAIDKNGLNRKDLTVADMMGIQEKIRRKDTDLMSSKEYNLRISQLDKIDNLISELDQIDGLTMTQGKLEYTHKEEIYNKLYAEAVKKAKSKANILVGALDKEIEGVIYIREGYLNVPQYNSNNIAMLRMASAEDANSYVDNNVDFAKQTFKFNVDIRFEISK